MMRVIIFDAMENSNLLNLLCCVDGTTHASVTCFVIVFILQQTSAKFYTVAYVSQTVKYSDIILTAFGDSYD